MKKNSLIILSIYLIVGVICTILNYENFRNAISTYNIVQQADELKYFEYGKILITKPSLTNSEKKEYQTLKTIAETTTLLKHLNTTPSLTSLIATGFGFTLPFALILFLVSRRKRFTWIISALLLIYIFSSFVVNANKANAEKEVTKYFNKKRSDEINKMFNISK